MPKRPRKKAGWRINGHNVYHVKGKTSSRRKTYKTKKSAQNASKRKGKRKRR